MALRLHLRNFLVTAAWLAGALAISQANALPADAGAEVEAGYPSYDSLFNETELRVRLSASSPVTGAGEAFCLKNAATNAPLGSAGHVISGDDLILRFSALNGDLKTGWNTANYIIAERGADVACGTADDINVPWRVGAVFEVSFLNAADAVVSPTLAEDTPAELLLHIRKLTGPDLTNEFFTLNVSSNNPAPAGKTRAVTTIISDFASSGAIAVAGSDLEGDGYYATITGTPTITGSLNLKLTLKNATTPGFSETLQAPGIYDYDAWSNNSDGADIQFRFPLDSTPVSAFNPDAYAFSIALKSASREVLCGATTLIMGTSGDLAMTGAACEHIISGNADSAQPLFTLNGVNACNYRQVVHGSVTEPDIIIYTDDNCLADLGTTASRTVTEAENASWCTPDANGDLALATSVEVTDSQVASCAVQGDLATSGSPNTFIVRSGADVNLRSGDTGVVRLLAGFHAEAGSYFNAKPGVDLVAARPLSQERLTLESAAAADTAASAATAAPRRLSASELPEGLLRLLEQRGVELSEAFASADGQWVVFSTAAPLTAMDANGLNDIYLYHDLDGQLTLVSVNANGTAGAGASVHPQIDGYGAYLVFGSEAGDLVADDTNGVSDIFLHEIATGALRRISWTLDGEESAAPARNPVLGSAQPEVIYDRPLANDGFRSLYYLNYNWPAQGTVDMGVAWGREWDLHHPAITADGRFLAHLETRPAADGGLDECAIRITDYAEGATELFACTEEQTAGHGYDLEFVEDGVYLDLIPQSNTEALRAYRLDNTLR